MERLKSYLNYIDEATFLLFIGILGFSLALISSFILDFKLFKIPEPKIYPHEKKEVKEDNNLKGLSYLFPKESSTSTSELDRKKEAMERVRINSIKLKGTIQVGRLKTALLSYNGKIYSVRIGDKIGDYKVEYINDFYIILSKGNKEYKIYLSVHSKRSSINKPKSVENKKDKKVVKISKHEIQRNMKTALKDIIAIPALRGGNMIGWRILKIKKGSIFDKYGLRRGDIIISINGRPAKEVTSISDFYNIIKNTKNINLEVKRGSETVEVFVEIE